jgi:glycerophosphoryl diester phosphodiesterase
MRLDTPASIIHRPEDQRRRPLTIAHRGASVDAPENTLAAVRRAVELGADAIEIDVQRSRDGALVVMHDTTLARTTDVRRVFPWRAPWRVADFTLDELRRLDAGSWKSARHAGERVPTLAEVLEVIGESSASLQLELKAPKLYPGVVVDLVSTLYGANGAGELAPAVPRVVVQSFDFAAMKELKTRVPRLLVGLLGTPKAANLPALATWADQVNPQHRSVNRSYVEKVHQHGMACLVWTVDASRAMSRAVALGVDGVITNRPDRFLTVLASGGNAQPRVSITTS